MLPYLWAMDVGCLTPGSNEGFSNAVLEQMAVGLPMIVTDVGGNAEAVANGFTGLVVPPLDVAALGDALVALYADRPLAASMGRAARVRVEECFSLQRMCVEHTKLYLALCGRPTGVPASAPSARASAARSATESSRRRTSSRWW